MENNTIFVGSKPVMNYVLAVVTQFNDYDNVTLRARGKAISRAVDAAEIVRNRFVPESEVTDIQISTEEIENYNNEKTNVSIIEIGKNLEIDANVQAEKYCRSYASRISKDTGRIKQGILRLCATVQH